MVKVSNDEEKSKDSIDVEEEEVETDESIALKGFVKQILSSVLRISDAIVTILDGASSKANLSKYGITINKKLLIKVESSGIGVYCSKLNRLINHEVKVISPDIICWQDGELIDELQSNSVQLNTEIIKESENLLPNNTTVQFHKSKTILPHWLDLLLFNNLGAIYSPEYKKFEYNLKIDSNGIKVYLGTYFPRSYAESFCIFDDLFKIRPYIEILNNIPEFNILDLGCGTGGELIGLIVALSKHITVPKVINILAVDGNHDALCSFGKIIEVLSSNVRHTISISCLEKTFQYERDIQFIDKRKRFHFILNSKMICELVSRKIIDDNCYYKIAEVLTQNLADNGIIYILDVTTKDEHSKLFYPQLMNQGLNDFISSHNDYATVLPLACNNWKECRDACFMQQTFSVSHSRKRCDDSRVCYRIICKQNFIQTFVPSKSLLKGCVHIIHPQKYEQNDKTSLCQKSVNGKKIIDSYNIRI